MPDREGHLCIGNGLLTDFETATYQVDRQVDAVYYLVGDYLQLPGLAQAEFEQAGCGPSMGTLNQAYKQNAWAAFPGSFYISSSHTQ